MAKPEQVYTGKLIVRNYSDEELRNSNLVIRESGDIGVVSDTPPPLGQDLHFEALYELKTDVKCVHGHQHRKGVVLCGDDGARYLVGNVCAQNQYGIDWSEFENAYKLKVLRQSDLLWLRHVSEAIAGAEPTLLGLLASPEVKVFDLLRSQTRGLPEPIRNVFQGAAVSANSRLTSTFYVRNHKEEQRQLNSIARDIEDCAKNPTSSKFRLQSLEQALAEAKKTPLYSWEPRQFIQCPAKTLFNGKDRMSVRLTQLVRDLLAHANRLQNADSNFKPGFVSKSLMETVQTLDAILGEVAEAVSMFNPTVLSQLEELFRGREFSRVKITRLNNGFRFEEDDGRTSYLTKPEALQAIGFKLADSINARG